MVILVLKLNPNLNLNQLTLTEEYDIGLPPLKCLLALSAATAASFTTALDFFGHQL